MADITKCSGEGCDLKESCYRFTANDGFRQSYFLNPPIVDGKCDMYWGEQSEEIWKFLKSVTQDKKIIQ